MKNEMTPGVAVAAVFGGFSSVVLAVLWGGFMAALALSLLWEWFFIPLFGLPAMSLLSAYGVVLGFRVAKGTPQVKKSEEGFAAGIVNAFVQPTFFYGMCILFGWIAKSFI